VSIGRKQSALFICDFGRCLNRLLFHVFFFRSVLEAEGRGLMFWGGRWGEIDIEDHSSRKLLLAFIVALGSFSSTTPHFWMNLLTVFSCSISLVSQTSFPVPISFE
jgi:hypothetical protein